MLLVDSEADFGTDVQDLLRVAGGDESLIVEMRSSVAKKTMMYQMANEELARDNNKRKTSELVEEEDMIGYKRLKEMVSESRELLANIKDSTVWMRDRVELTRVESSELEKQIMMRSKERSEILEFEEKRRLKEFEKVQAEMDRSMKHKDDEDRLEEKRCERELEFHKKLHDSKLTFERELQQIRNAPKVAAVPAVAEPKVYTFPELSARDGGVEVCTVKTVAAALMEDKKFGLKKEQWKTVLCKAGVAAATKLNVRAKVFENQLPVNAFWPEDQGAIKRLVEDEIRNFKAGPSSGLVQPPIHLSLRVHVEPPPQEPANRASQD